VNDMEAKVALRSADACVIIVCGGEGPNNSDLNGYSSRHCQRQTSLVLIPR
jgi:hypothetical protein